MEFNQELMFLGMSYTESEQYGGRYTVDMFCPGGEAWKFSVKENEKNTPLLNNLSVLTCGMKVECKLRLMKMRDGSMYLGLVDVAVE